MPAPAKPRLKQGETPDSPAFKKRMEEYNRAVALAEATKAQQEQAAREELERTERDILKEAESRVPAKEKPKEPAPKSEGSIKPTNTRARDRAKLIEEAVEGGIKEADEANKQARKK